MCCFVIVVIFLCSFVASIICGDDLVCGGSMMIPGSTFNSSIVWMIQAVFGGGVSVCEVLGKPRDDSWSFLCLEF